MSLKLLNMLSLISGWTADVLHKHGASESSISVVKSHSRISEEAKARRKAYKRRKAAKAARRRNRK